MKTLVVVESPAKAKKIQKFLGSEYLVIASMGHFRNIDKKGIDVNNNFKTTYCITKGNSVKNIKDAYKKCDDIILAADQDREGEAIAWHVAQILKLDKPKRMVFNEITKKAILDAIKNIRTIDYNLVQAQQARQVSDMLIGFEISPILWKYIKMNLSAGRVQSPTTKLVMDREQEIDKFQSKPYFKINGLFNPVDKNNSSIILEGDLNKNFDDKKTTLQFLEKCKKEKFTIGDISKKKVKRFPNAPFITSTMQQEAGNKLGMSSKNTMANAQKLYELGYITYHRTDGTDLAPVFIDALKEYVTKKYGENYLNIRKYKSKNKNAQEAHEAIRPTKIENYNLNDDELTGPQKSLYKLIWKRAVASQMAPAEVDIYTCKINISNCLEYFVTKAEEITFPGFKVIYDYVEKKNEDDDEFDSKKNDKNLKAIKSLQKNQLLNYKRITATEKYTKAQGRYTEASLIKKMENLGIGRPSTYASIITKIQEREYVIKDTRKGRKVKTVVIMLENNKIDEKEVDTTLDAEKNKLFPTDIGKQTNKFLNENFDLIMKYDFTAQIEQELDDIANGKKIWHNVVKNLYEKFHPIVNKLDSEATDNKTQSKYNKRLVGKEKGTDNNIYAYIGPHGPCLQIGEKGVNLIPKFVGLKPEQSIETITEDEANALLVYPKILGQHNGKDIKLREGRFGKYLEYNKKNYSLSTGKDEVEKTNNDEINLEEAISLIEKRDEKVIKEINKTIKILNGPYGPYILNNKKIVKIPQDYNPRELTLKDVKEITENAPKKKPFKKFVNKKK